MSRKHKGQGYAGKLLDGVSRLQPIPGSVTIVKVLHEDSCSIWKTGVCDCDPDAELPPWPGRS